MNTSLQSQSLQNSQIPELSLDTLKQQNGFQKMKKPSQYGTTHQKIEIAKDQIYQRSVQSPQLRKSSKTHSRQQSGSNGSSQNIANSSQYSTQIKKYSSNINNSHDIGSPNNMTPRNISSPRNILSPRDVSSPLNIGSPQNNNSPQNISSPLNLNSPVFNGYTDHIRKSSNFSEMLQNQDNTEVDPIQPDEQESDFFKKNELYVREIISTISSELSNSPSELKLYLTAYGMSDEIFTFYLNRFLELSCGKEEQTQIFFKINDIIYEKTISLLQNNDNFKPILKRLEGNKHLILPKTLLEQICSRDLLKQIIQKVYDEAKNSIYMSEFFTSDKQINTESAIQILEDAFSGNYSELQGIVNHVFGKNKFTHVFFYFFKYSLQNYLKKLGIPKVLIYKMLEKVESFRYFIQMLTIYYNQKSLQFQYRYLLVEDHECIEFKTEIEKSVFQTLTSDSLRQKIPRISYLNGDQQLRLAKIFVKYLIFQPEIQILNKHMKAITDNSQLQIVLIDQVYITINQYLQKKDMVDETIHELSLRREKLLLSLDQQSNLISDINNIRELIDMIKKGVKKEKHMIDDQKFLENPIMLQTYLESLNSPYNCTSFKDWMGCVQLSQVTSWQIGVWFRILKLSLIKLKYNHQTQFILEQELNFISNQ